jgi:hypothetical protein
VGAAASLRRDCRDTGHMGLRAVLDTAEVGDRTTGLMLGREQMDLRLLGQAIHQSLPVSDSSIVGTRSFSRLVMMRQMGHAGR